MVDAFKVWQSGMSEADILDSLDDPNGEIQVLEIDPDEEYRHGFQTTHGFDPDWREAESPWLDFCRPDDRLSGIPFEQW